MYRKCSKSLVNPKYERSKPMTMKENCSPDGRVYETGTNTDFYSAKDCQFERISTNYFCDVYCRYNSNNNNKKDLEESCSPRKESRSRKITEKQKALLIYNLIAIYSQSGSLQTSIYFITFEWTRK